MLNFNVLVIDQIVCEMDRIFLDGSLDKNGFRLPLVFTSKLKYAATTS